MERIYLPGSLSPVFHGSKFTHGVVTNPTVPGYNTPLAAALKPDSVACGVTFHSSSEAVKESRTQGALVYAETTIAEEPGLLRQAKLIRPKGTVPQKWKLGWSELRTNEMMAPRESEEVPKMFLLQDVLEFHNLF